MAQFRPAGFSDEETDSDEYGFFEKPTRRYYSADHPSAVKKTENRLQNAIINGNLSEVESIITLDLHSKVDTKLDSGWTPLMHACFHAQEDVVTYLLSLNADPNLHADSVTPIMVACSNSSANNDTIYNIIMQLIDKNCLLNIGDKYGQTPLMRAISSGRMAVVQELLNKQINIEMRDQQGWTALFWAVHHNQPDILELLIAQGARLNEVDKNGRTLVDIAYQHDYQNIVEILDKYNATTEKNDDIDKRISLRAQAASWYDYYPGLTQAQRPDYATEIQHLLYGMSCEHLTRIIDESGIDLRTFLLLDEDGMIKVGIDMPYERQRLKHGLRNFHLRGWKLNAVAGLYARNNENYSVIDCLTTLGTHLQQVYILEATLQYTVRAYNKNLDKIKFEPPDSPLKQRMKDATRKIVSNINSIRREIKHLKTVLIKINKDNPQPADLIKPKTTHDIIIGYVTEVIVISSLGLLVYHARNVMRNFLK